MVKKEVNYSILIKLEVRILMYRERVGTVEEWLLS